MNDLVDMLTRRVCELELRLADEQEASEAVTAERDATQERLERAEALCTGERVTRFWGGVFWSCC